MLQLSRVKMGIAALALGSMVGCSSNGSFSVIPSNSGPDSERTQLAAYSASAHYPDRAQIATDLQIASLVNQNKGTIRLFNFTDKPMADMDVWVNNTFVRKVASIPAYGSITLPTSSFFDSTGRDLKSTNSTVRVVQLGWHGDNKLYNALGPAFE